MREINDSGTRLNLEFKLDYFTSYQSPPQKIKKKKRKNNGNTEKSRLKLHQFMSQCKTVKSKDQEVECTLSGKSHSIQVCPRDLPRHSAHCVSP